MLIRRFIALFAFGISLLSSGVAIAQTSPAPVPAQALPFSPRVPHVNAPLGDIPRIPGDGNGAYKMHEYHDLFSELGHSSAESHAKIEKAFQQLFHGDGQEERIYFETGANANGPLAYITDWANNDARSEGMSYGMMIAVQLNKKREFDAIWNWANTYMLITDEKNPSVGYFAWSMNTDGTPRSTGAAPDGEEYFVMALYFAAHRWGNGQGIYNYQAEADKILGRMRHHPVITATGPFRVHPDDREGPCPCEYGGHRARHRRVPPRGRHARRDRRRGARRRARREPAQGMDALRHGSLPRPHLRRRPWGTSSSSTRGSPRLASRCAAATRPLRTTSS